MDQPSLKPLPRLALAGLVMALGCSTSFAGVKHDIKHAGKSTGHAIHHAARATGHAVHGAVRATGHGIHRAAHKVKEKL